VGVPCSVVSFANPFYKANVVRKISRNLETWPAASAIPRDFHVHRVFCRSSRTIFAVYAEGCRVPFQLKDENESFPMRNLTHLCSSLPDSHRKNVLPP